MGVGKLGAMGRREAVERRRSGCECRKPGSFMRLWPFQGVCGGEQRCARFSLICAQYRPA